MRKALRLLMSLILLVALNGGCMSESNDVAVKVADLPEKYHEVLVRGLDFSPDGSRIAVQSDGEKVNIWDWRQRRIVATVEKPRGAPGATESNPIRYSPDGRFLAACDSQGVGDVVVRLWNTSDWSIANDITDSGPGSCDAMDFTPDGKLLVRAVDRLGDPSEVIAHSVGTWGRSWALRSEVAVRSIAINPEGNLLAAAGVLTIVPPNHNSPRLDDLIEEPTVTLVMLSSRQVVGVMKGDAAGPLAWNPGGTRIALAGRGYVEVFEVRSGRRLVHEKLEDSAQMHVRYTPDGRYFVESDVGGRASGWGARIWDAEHRTLLATIPGNFGDISISRDGKYLALGGAGHTSVWEFKQSER